MEFAGPVKYNIVDPPKEPEPEPEEVATEIGEVIQTREDKDPIVEEMMSDELEDALPKFKPNPQPDPEMFEEEPPETLRKPRVRKVKEPDELPEEPLPPTTKGGKRKGYNKNGKKRKPMSEEHKAKLALAREKALEKKRYLKQKRAEEKAEKEEMKALETKVETKRKTKKKQELIKELEDEEDKAQPLQRTQSTRPMDIPKPRSIAQPQQQFITREDLEKAQLSTLVAYEQMRKARKAEKKKKQQEEEYQEQVKQTIQKINGWKDTAGIYGNCF